MNFFLISIVGITLALIMIIGYILIDKLEKLNMRSETIQNKGLFYMIVVSFFVNLILSMFVIMQFYAAPCQIMETCSTLLSYTFLLFIPFFYLVLIFLCILFVVKSILNKLFERMNVYIVLAVIFSVSVIFLIKFFFQFLRPYFSIV